MPIPRIICIVGPTSSGKTSLSLEIAKQFKGEIVNADARQLYKGFDIGTGKPSVSDREEIPHHLFNEDPRSSLTVSEWRKKALACLEEISKRQHMPILVGGTGLYIQSLVDNLSIPEVAPQPELREKLSQRSLEEMVNQLRELDPDAAEIVDLKNPRRVMRALEVTLSSNQRWSETQQKGSPLVDALQIGIARTREELYTRSEKAVDSMLESGWVEEVRSLLDAGISPTADAMSAIGYRELAEVIQGALSQQDAIDQIKQATRNYIKRQITWFKRDERIHWVKDFKEARVLVQDFFS